LSQFRPKGFSISPDLVVDLPADQEIFLSRAGIDGHDGLRRGVQGLRLFRCQFDHGVLLSASSYDHLGTSDKTSDFLLVNLLVLEHGTCTIKRLKGP
jgi:hypothetical protein